jgi:hypothetical protein
MKKLLAALSVFALVLFASAPADAFHGGMGGGGFGGGGFGMRGFGGGFGPRFGPGFGMRGYGFGPRAYGFNRGFIRPGFNRGFRSRRRFFPGAFAFGAPFGFGGFGGFGGGGICEELTTGQVFAC